VALTAHYADLPPRAEPHQRNEAGLGAERPSVRKQAPDGPASWSASELALFTGEGSLTLHAGDDPPGHGESVELGMVVAGKRLFVRAYRGPGSRWYQAALAARQGWIRARGDAWQVTLSPADDQPHGDIDIAYQAKYGHLGAAATALVLSPGAHKATLRISPR
jgi:hypothetical protein